MTAPTAAEAREEIVKLIEGLSIAQLAALTEHEYDDEHVIPPNGSPGAAFLESALGAYTDRVRSEGRFPDLNSEGEIGWYMTQWGAQEAGTRVAYAFADLGLCYSHHAVDCDAAISGLRRALDSAAEQFVVTLTQEYGPLV